MDYLNQSTQHLHPDNKRPSKNWIYAFLKRNPNIVLSSASGLDPKRAKAFNRPVVNRYFDELKELVEFQLRTFITWTRRDVRGVVRRKLAEESIYTPGDSVQAS